jgi:YXWGXW repeat-containing protein
MPENHDELSFLAQTATSRKCEGLCQNHCEPDRMFTTSRPEIAPLPPRSPQQQSLTGHAKDHRAKGITMSITRFIRSPLFALVLFAMSAAAYGQISVSISFAPPELPVYEQPLCPGDGYLWTPGYWAYAGDDDDYYWVPGTWVMAPEPGLLWTPAYWSWGGNGYVFYDGYWGQQVGFYGGVSYGYGYFGDGYQGGRWQGGQFYYNRSVSNVNVTSIHNVYNTTVINTTITRVSYNGGNGGIRARPTPQQESAVRERHIPPVAAQTQHEQAARTNPEQRASVNHGTPAVAATPKPGAFSDHAVVHAKQTGTPYNAPVNRAAVQPPANTPAAHPENNAARSDQPASNKQPESSRAPSARPNQPEPNRPEPDHPPTAQPDRKPEPNRAPAAQPNNRPEPNRNEPGQRPLTPPPSQRSQPERTAPPLEARSAAQQPQRPQPAPTKAEEKKSQNEKPKENQKPQ